MSDFESLGLSQKALEAVRVLGYEEPTPVQEQTIPLVLEGKDVIAGAQTGTGKTAAFCLPLMDTLPRAKKHCGPLMLVVTPTRELADQIGQVCQDIAKVTKHKVTIVVGGVSYNGQTQTLKAGTDVLIATPGRLEDLMGQEAVSLDQVQALVIDEADRMLDMGFSPAVNRIAKACTASHQTLLFSATIDKAVQKFAAAMQTDPARVEIARRGETAETVDQYIVRISHAAKPSALKAVLTENGAQRVIVFARTRHRADACARRIKKMGYRAEAIHSDRSQNQRRRTLSDFDKGKLNVIVATDVLARGIDIDQVDYVVNYDLPMQPEDYVHRIGRTGRAGARGFAVSLVSPETEENLAEIQKLIGKELPTMELFSLDREAAEAEAEARSMQLQARRSKDPEVEAVVKELTDKKRKERKKQAKAQAEREEGGQKSSSGKKQGGKKASSNKKVMVPASAAKSADAESKPGSGKKNGAAANKNAAGKKGAANSSGKKSAASASPSKKPGSANGRASSKGKKGGNQKGANQQGKQKAQWAVKSEKCKEAIGKMNQDGEAKRARKSSGKDMRPGRSHRAAQAQRRARF